MHGNTTSPDCASNDDDFAPPAWLIQALRTAPVVSDTFRAECLRSAETAVALSKLRQANERMGLSLLAVPAYLRGLAAVASTPLDPILQWAGLRSNQPPDRDFASAWCRLARAVGLGLQEALLHLRLTFAEEVGVELAPALVRQRASGASPSTVISECEEFLAREASQWDEEVRARLRVCESVLHEGYTSGSEERAD